MTMKIKEKAEKLIDKINEKGMEISKTNRYKERLKTSFISVFLYFVLIYVARSDSILPVKMPEPAFYIAGVIIVFYNIVKSILSMRDHKYIKANVIALILQVISLVMFIYLFIKAWEVYVI